ncbi:ubiquitin-related domain-containing protein [Coniella lustricola]|uniref:Ubiquitin-related domain-containing protein n=1 Tax=Coniella lustricola TaxID=2025994 RepID=A0A2T3AHT7_9PEZI|nr:ubiquitin-related domain-containing protein [Coniella lustricola]
MASDLETLLEMGFDKARAELAVKKSGGLQGALEWLEKNQDTPLDQLQTPEDDDAEATAAAIQGLEDGQLAKSLVCDDCGKQFRTTAMAEFHASKSGHENFSESTEDIKPLTEEEKKQKLAEMRAALAEKRSRQAEADKEESKRNEAIKRKATRETQDAKEELQRKEQIKEAAKKRQEKLDDLEAKRRIKAKIEADKEERRRKAEEAKAVREGKAPPAAAAAVEPSAPAAPSKPKSSASYTDARLRLQTPGGAVQKSFPAETTLFEVAEALRAEGTSVTNFTMTFPRKVFEASEFGQTLREVGLVPSGVLIVK